MNPFFRAAFEAFALKHLYSGSRMTRSGQLVLDSDPVVLDPRPGQIQDGLTFSLFENSIYPLFLGIANRLGKCGSGVCISNLEYQMPLRSIKRPTSPMVCSSRSSMRA
ncbi:hypothetical protein ACHAXA_008160 [Cyclostephanos tholiformis]|uniref:Uncharacterized protein n=1 Tax=Cyclostephanos tholiformis TaxID=382380 RepID=A0ABD3RGC5_9STRA